jgi:DNA-binding NtrC family response regulator
MAHVQLLLNDPAARMLLKAMLEADGHKIVSGPAEITICDNAETAESYADKVPSLFVTPISGVPRAVEAMRKGVYGYILLPLQSGEAGVMVRRAIDGAAKPDTVDLSTLEAAELRHIEAVVRHCRGNRVEASKILGIGRNTLWRKLGKAKRRAKSD